MKGRQVSRPAQVYRHGRDACKFQSLLTSQVKMFGSGETGQDPENLEDPGKGLESDSSLFGEDGLATGGTTDAEELSLFYELILVRFLCPRPGSGSLTTPVRAGVWMVRKGVFSLSVIRAEGLLLP